MELLGSMEFHYRMGNLWVRVRGKAIEGDIVAGHKESAVRAGKMIISSLSNLWISQDQ